MTNGNEPEYNPMADIAAATNEMVAMAAQRHTEGAALRDAQVVIDNAEWNSLTPQEQAARMAAAEAYEWAHLDERRAELHEDIEPYASDPEPKTATRSGGCLGRAARGTARPSWRGTRVRPASHASGISLPGLPSSVGYLWGSVAVSPTVGFLWGSQEPLTYLANQAPGIQVLQLLHAVINLRVTQRGRDSLIGERWFAPAESACLSDTPRPMPLRDVKAQLLEAKDNLQRMFAAIPLTDDEKAAVDDGNAALDALLGRLADVPTPAGPATPADSSTADCDCCPSSASSRDRHGNGASAVLQDNERHDV